MDNWRPYCYVGITSWQHQDLDNALIVSSSSSSSLYSDCWAQYSSYNGRAWTVDSTLVITIKCFADVCRLHRDVSFHLPAHYKFRITEVRTRVRTYDSLLERQQIKPLGYEAYFFLSPIINNRSVTVAVREILITIPYSVLSYIFSVCVKLTIRILKELHNVNC